MAAAAARFPSVEETLRHPAYASTIWALEPHQKGKTAVAKTRGGPVSIAWEIHGSGPTRIALIMGLAGTKSSWQRQTSHFGHDRGDEYSVLVFDNRGIGESDKPLGRYSSSEMAADLIEVLDAVGWTADRSVHLAGISLGGMIAQEVACAVPARLASLSLLCTSAHIQSGKGLHVTLRERASMLIPKGEEVNILDTGKKLFTDEFLFAKDEARLPSPKTTPKCGPAKGTPDGEYLTFDNNFQRFQAQELQKRHTPGYFTLPGFLSQLVAAGWHRKSAEQLRDMADAVGRERILVMHGTLDNMITVQNGEKLIEMLKPGVGLIMEGMGHAPVMERTDWYNSLMEERLAAWKKLDETS